jgi:hypothetical protein
MHFLHIYINLFIYVLWKPVLYLEPRVWSTYSSLCCMPLDVSGLQQSELSLDVSVSVLQQSVLLDVSAQQQPVLCQNVYGQPIAACAATGLHVSLHVPVLHLDLSSESSLSKRAFV